MYQNKDFPHPFRLGPWLVQPDLNRISGPNGENRIEPRIMQVLLCLSERPGEVWTRQALLDQVWGESVVGEEILTRAISELRRVFGDKARDPLFIETIRHHGYRLLETPRPVQKEAPPEPEALPASPSTSIRPKPLLISALVVLLMVLAVIIGRGLIPSNRETANHISPFSPALPLTSFPGREWHPALSADGTRVAFVWSGPKNESTEIYVKQRNSETLLQLTDSPAWVAWPTWSPDGQTVAFVQGGPESGTLSLVPSLGGAVRSLHTVTSWVEGLDFAPDGQSLVFSARAEGSGKFGIFQLNLQDLEVKRLSLVGSGRAGDFQPRFSPDGTTLAWVGVGLSGHSSLYQASLPNGSARRVGGDLANLQGLTFSSDGQHLIYSASPAGRFNLWRIPVTAGRDAAPEWLPTPGDFAWNPRVARQSGDLVFEQVRVDQDIWRIRILERDPWQLETEAFLQSTRWEYEADFSADGKQIAFISARGGAPEIWLADIDGRNPRKLTNLGSTGLTNLRWSPDGRQLAFNILQQGRPVIMVSAARGGKSRVSTPPGDGELFCCWSHDGNSLLFGSDRENGWNIWRRNLEDGTTRPVISLGAVTAAESRDGSTLYFTRSDRPGLWRLPLDEDGHTLEREEPELVLEDLTNQDRHNWVLRSGQVYWVFRLGGTPMLAATDLATGHFSLLAELPGLAGDGLAVSPDGSSILYPRTGRMEGDLMVLEYQNQ